MSEERIQLLVVDDNKDFTDIFCDYMDLCYDKQIEIIGVANNGVEAIDMIISKQPDIVILDIIMPVLDGIGVLKKINMFNLKIKPIFIMLSAIGQNKIIQEALDLGAVYYIEKPFNFETLVNKIIQLIFIDHNIT